MVGGVFGAAVGGTFFFLPALGLYQALLSKHSASRVREFLERDQHKQAALTVPWNPCPAAALLGAILIGALLGSGMTWYGFAWVLASEVVAVVLLRLISRRDDSDPVLRSQTATPPGRFSP